MTDVMSNKLSNEVVTMETSASPISTSSFRELPPYAPRSQRSGSNQGREQLKNSSPKQAFSVPAWRHTQEDDTGNVLASAKHLHKCVTSEKRKEAARRRLLGTMYSKQNDVNRSFSFVAGERPQNDIKFPSVPVVCFKNKTPEPRNGTGNTSNAHISKDRPMLETNREKNEPLFYMRPGTKAQSKGPKVSLPEIIMEFNLEASMAANERDRVSSSRTDEDEDERALGVPYEDFLRQPKYIVHNPCRARYRPVTPGLLESLNKSRVPSKVKTEQWVKSIQTSRKSYCGSSYKVGNLDNSNLAVPNWIYEYR